MTGACAGCGAAVRKKRSRLTQDDLENNSKYLMCLILCKFVRSHKRIGVYKFDANI